MLINSSGQMFFSLVICVKKAFMSSYKHQTNGLTLLDDCNALALSIFRCSNKNTDPSYETCFTRGIPTVAFLFRLSY